LRGHDSLWGIIRRGDGDGGLAVRLAHCWGGAFAVRRVRRRGDELLRLEVGSAIGKQVSLRHDDIGLARLRVTLSPTRAEPLLIPYLPRDLYPLGKVDDPLANPTRSPAPSRIGSITTLAHKRLPSFRTRQPAVSKRSSRSPFRAQSGEFRLGDRSECRSEKNARR
jgi:hypothetical protein